MIRTSLGAFAALAIAAVFGAVALLGQSGGVEAQSHSATRSFAVDWSAPRAEFEISIDTSNLGGFGQVVETLPAGFTYVRSSLDDFQVDVDGQEIAFNLLGNANFTYVVTVPAAEGLYTFSGVVKNADLEERTIAGDTMLRVGPPPTPEPTATHTPVPADTPTPEPTATPTVIVVEATATPEPTATPMPEDTPTPEPTATPEPTPTPEPTATPEPVVIIVVPTEVPSPTPTATATVAAGPPEGGGGVPGLLWLIVVIGGIGFILAVFSYMRTRS